MKKQYIFAQSLLSPLTYKDFTERTILWGRDSLTIPSSEVLINLTSCLNGLTGKDINQLINYTDLLNYQVLYSIQHFNRTSLAT
ncbi:hypothetical protein FRX31_020511 [Thalictrum thalictroides]|uniref:Uncharacterized protein n=1 Tax=Thalictrum thalictroides TaxID=46969 RepID=A0A7J6VYG4_THATH|nr:hypothetical protein FRX31_020511 [Thalictrum thalictroides]